MLRNYRIRSVRGTPAHGNLGQRLSAAGRSHIESWHRLHASRARGVGPGWAAAIGDLSTWWVYLLGPLVGVVIAVGVAYVLRGPAKAQEALAAEGTPLDQTT